MRRKPSRGDVAKKNAEYEEFPGRAYLQVEEAKRRQKIAERDLAKSKRWTPERTFWLLGLVPITLVAVHLLIAARGDPDALRSLVQNLNVTAIFLATILPFATMAVAFLCLSVLLSECSRYRAIGDPLDPDSSAAVFRIGIAIVFGTCVAVFSCFTMPLKLLIATAGICGFWAMVFIGAERKHRFRATFQRAGVLYLVVLMVGGLVYVLLSGIWLPRERLSIGAEQTGAVYVLSSDGEWTKYLDERTNDGHIVRTKDIKQRELVPDSDTWPNWTVAQLISRI